MEKIVERCESDPVRNFVFESGSCDLRSIEKRGRGRPRTRWATKVYETYCDIVGRE